MPHKIRVEAKEVSLAIEKGLKDLGLRRDQVEIKILENPRKGFLGIGSKPAIVELQKKRWASGNLDAQIYMDVPKKKRSSGKKGNNHRGRRHEGVPEFKHGGRRSYSARHTTEKAPRENEAQLLPSLEIQQAVVPDFLKEPLQQAKNYLEDVLTHMGVKVENLNAWWDEKQNRILLTFDCDHPAIVIGKDGKTLEALQYLATLSISRHFDKPISVIADTQNYWRKAEDKINAELQTGIEKIKNGYSVYRFRPMSAQLRRYIHRAAENNEFAITVSEGEGQWRKVTLRPRPADKPVQKTATPAVAEAVAPAQPAPTITQTNLSSQVVADNAPVAVEEICVTTSSVTETVTEGKSQVIQTQTEGVTVVTASQEPVTTAVTTEDK